MGPVDYVVVTPDRRKARQLCHINMLKEYHEANGDKVEVCAVVTTSMEPKPEAEEAEAECDCLDARLNNLAVLANLQSKLAANEVSELQHLLLDNSQQFPDTPTRTSVLCHDVDVGDAQPVKQHAYRVNPKAFQQEVKYDDGCWTSQFTLPFSAKARWYF